ncbi:enediyne polyketide synthase [Nonomuraea polychroma]|uniref:Enediyne polyketide synthase n=1 Tax=Nonomuraea polychroma TaxID=46176 RepID=A0A438M1U4_9ACTN|nr:type I polyketide synthase [Nonomuraea polychroma]RVX39779.1 enediyne polyketide synthase [Nonomuraea polychroma]
MTDAIAIVGMGCRYPDASDPGQLWENVLACRRSFRPIPRERLNLEDYAPDGGDADSTYVRFAGVLEGWQFDRARFRIPGSAHRVTDTTHWLALDVAADALAAAGYPDARGLDRDRVAVVLGNSMNGEFSRAVGLRVRWPYVRRVLQGALAEEGWTDEQRAGFLAAAEQAFKAPFPEPNDESLAGALANTMAGRVCNHFDLHGGGYTVDGACASSLLAVTTACSTLLAGEADFVLAGGVDISLDPFELVGFARTGALATSDMRIYDASPTGFWPGEGCGMVALMRWEDAMAAGRTPLALIRGWGVSSDGRGGISRPEKNGQLLALWRAYTRAGWGPETISLFEGHGTGTAIGDEVELSALIEAHRCLRRDQAAALGSIKANIGHTKAAAGVAGLLKATLALQRQVIPPTTGCREPHQLLRRDGAPLRIVSDAEPWPEAPLRAAVSAMGFGGINTHVVLESEARRRRNGLSAAERKTATRPLSHEAFVVGGDTVRELAGAVARVAETAGGMAFAQHVDLAAELAATAAERSGRFRMGIVARDPDQLARRAVQALSMLDDLEGNAEGIPLMAPGIVAAHGRAATIGLLFTGQGAPPTTSAGALGKVLPEVESVFTSDWTLTADTAVAQPSIVRASLAGLKWLAKLGVRAEAAVGHSLGEITALHWAGALSETDLLDLVTRRGRLMSELGTPGSGMVSIAASAASVAEFIDDTSLTIAADNGVAQVVAGPLPDIEKVLERAARAGVTAQRLRVSHAFHTQEMKAVEHPLSEHLSRMAIRPVERRVYSTISGRLLTPAHDLRRLLTLQVTSPVHFGRAVTALAAECDLLVEVGPGQGLASMAAAQTSVPAVALGVGSASAEGLCLAGAALYAAGAISDLRPFFAERFHRPFDLDRAPEFLSNPCERAAEPAPRSERPSPGEADHVGEADRVDDVPAMVRALVADALELPSDAIADDDRLLSDLHLNSLRVAQLSLQAVTAAGRAMPIEPLIMSDVSVADLARAIEALPAGGDGDEAAASLPGLADWHRILLPTAEPVTLPEQAETYAWQVVGAGPLLHGLASLLPVPSAERSAMLIFLPEDPTDSDVDVMVSSVRAAVAEGMPLTVVDHGDTASGLLATIRQEYPGQVARWIGVADCHSPGALLRVLRSSGEETPEILLDSAGRPCVPAYRPIAHAGDHSTLPLTAADVVLVTGGGKGIGFETALALGRASAARIALLGRSRPDSDEELRANLAKLTEAGITFVYERADVTDAASTHRAIDVISRTLGTITAVVHSSGVNRPQRFADLDAAAFADHSAPKHHGLRNVIAALDRDALRVVISYGSVIGRFGLGGEAHYALANGRLREYMRILRRELPQCQVCDVDWTVWSGAGMGERFDVLDSLMRAGVVPLPSAKGTDLLLELLTVRPDTSSVVVTGRLPQLTCAYTAAEHRYVQTAPFFVPGIELVAEAELSAEADPYLADHRIDGLRVLPAVCMLEAMAQSAHVLTGSRPMGIADARFDRAILVPDEGTRTIRLCALVREDGDIDVAVRSDESGYAVDHASARILMSEPPETVKVPEQRLSLPSHDGRGLYGGLFFHGPLFQRLRGYQHLEATGCTAVLASGPDFPFGPGLPTKLMLGDPARNDASIHVLQACVPQRRLLPVGCAAFIVQTTRSTDGELVLSAVEREHSGADYLYDVTLRERSGRPVLSWTGLRLRDVGPLDPAGGRPDLLLAPYLERGAAALIPDSPVRVEVTPSGADRASARQNGRGRSHLDGLAMAVHGRGVVACDWEWADGDPEALRGLIAWTAQAREIARLTGEPEAHVLTRLWTVRECLSKTGRTGQASLTVAGAYEQGWVLMRAGKSHVASAIVDIGGESRPAAVAVLVEGES